MSKIKIVDKLGWLCNLGGGTGMAITSAPPSALISGHEVYMCLQLGARCFKGLKRLRCSSKYTVGKESMTQLEGWPVH